MEKRRPNVILILADDMGFSDLGVTGSEIKTPNIDSLAEGGTMLSAMYNCARCCPTRASLLTGLYPHNSGIGHMGTNIGVPSYQGFLRKDCGTIAEHLRAGGYKTFMSGKWHVAGDFEAKEVATWQIGEPDHPTPNQRGFDRFYGIMDGATHYFSPHCILEDETRVTDIPDDFYLTDAITDKGIAMIEDSADDDAPFFLYLAHTAPHWPLHAPEEDIANYDGVYRKGWDEIRAARHEEMNGKDVFPQNWDISLRDPDVHSWEDEPHQEWEASKMATYAAMVDRLDQSFGRLISVLKKNGQFDNTLILFLSDNGGCAEFMAEDGWAKFYPDVTHDGKKITMGNVPDLRPGDAQTFQSYDKPWANVSNAPFRLFKHFVHEGGISTPLIAHWPEGFGSNATAHTPCHVVDIMPTILEVTGCAYQSELNGAEIQPEQGESFLPLLKGQAWERQAPIFWEHEGNAAVRWGNFKLVCVHQQAWELYDMNEDRTELQNLAGKHPKQEGEMAAQYFSWARKSGVIPWEMVQPKVLSAWGLKTSDG